MAMPKHNHAFNSTIFTKIIIIIRTIAYYPLYELQIYPYKIDQRKKLSASDKIFYLIWAPLSPVAF